MILKSKMAEASLKIEKLLYLSNHLTDFDNLYVIRCVSV